MFWTAVASSTLLSKSADSSAGLASAAPSYQQQHTKPLLRSSASSWQLSNAAFKSRLQQQQLLHQQQIQQQHEEQELQEEQPYLEELARGDRQPKKEPKDVKEKQQQAANCKKKISLKRESKIFKAFTSCKCTRK